MAEEDPDAEYGLRMHSHTCTHTHTWTGIQKEHTPMHLLNNYLFVGVYLREIGINGYKRRDV